MVFINRLFMLNSHKPRVNILFCVFVMSLMRIKAAPYLNKSSSAHIIDWQPYYQVFLTSLTVNLWIKCSLINMFGPPLCEKSSRVYTFRNRVEALFFLYTSVRASVSTITFLVKSDFAVFCHEENCKVIVTNSSVNATFMSYLYNTFWIEFECIVILINVFFCCR